MALAATTYDLQIQRYNFVSSWPPRSTCRRHELHQLVLPWPHLGEDLNAIELFSLQSCLMELPSVDVDNASVKSQNECHDDDAFKAAYNLRSNG